MASIPLFSSNVLVLLVAFRTPASTFFSSFHRRWITFIAKERRSVTQRRRASRTDHCESQLVHHPETLSNFLIRFKHQSRYGIHQLYHTYIHTCTTKLRFSSSYCTIHTHSLGLFNTSSSLSSLLPFSGSCMYCHLAVSGKLMRMLSTRDPGVFRPNAVPRSCTRLNST